MENTDERTLALIRKGGAASTDREAIRLLRQHNILSMATWVAGFEDETDRDLWRSLKQIIAYDPDQIQALYVTPHRWAPYYRLAAERPIVEADQTRWDYKHQVLAMRQLPLWRLILWVKLIELAAQLRPRALRRWLWNPDPKIRHAIRWYYRMGRHVWLHEVGQFLFKRRPREDGRSVADLLGTPQDHEEEASSTARQTRSTAAAASLSDPLMSARG